jgi:hypothetical protein
MINDTSSITGAELGLRRSTLDSLARSPVDSLPTDMLDSRSVTLLSTLFLRFFQHENFIDRRLNQKLPGRAFTVTQSYWLVMAVVTGNDC